MLADACCHAGRYHEALAAIDEGLASSALTSDRYWDSELERLRGEALQHTGAGRAEISACFERSITDARARGAKSLELRSATSAARFSVGPHDRALAQRALSNILASFTEGFDTADLIEARMVLDSMS